MATDKGAATIQPRKDPARAQAPASRPQRAPGSPRGDGFIGRASRYLGEVRAELKKTTWPTRQELIAQTKVVLGLLLIIGVFIATWDFVLGRIVDGLFTIMGVPKTMR